MTFKSLALTSVAGAMLLCAPVFAQENHPASMQDEAMPAQESIMENAMEKPASAAKEEKVEKIEKAEKKSHNAHHANKESKKAPHANHSEKSKKQHAKHGKEHPKHASKSGHMKKERLAHAKPKAKETVQEAAPAAGQ